MNINDTTLQKLSASFPWLMCSLVFDLKFTLKIFSYLCI